MIEQGFIYAEYTIKEMTDFFETRIENLQLKEDKKKTSAGAKNRRKRRVSGTTERATRNSML